ncbi:alpha/beta fold hydrolase [Halorubellus salinus]|uniref:alpha/beta fold hydrolase n=1 Tax=Halorubellus salinus TaxID=755309 RepID=UPI001D083158|nr:alpha/beta hydrolase [Halorubellus salinus]
MSADRPTPDRVTAGGAMLDRVTPSGAMLDRVTAGGAMLDRIIPERFRSDEPPADAAGDDTVDLVPSEPTRTGALVAIAVAGGATAFTVLAREYATYRRERDAAYARVAPTEHHVAHTPVGDVEYRDRGTGVPVLVSHGIVGGSDQAMQIGNSLVDDARIVAPSRFGYLGSDVPTYPSPATQARAFAELLDDLDVDDAVVVGTSAGAAAAIRFALDHPERTRALVLLAAGTPPADATDDHDGPTGPPAPLLRDPTFWLLRSRAPWLLRRTFGVSSDDWAAAADADRDRVDALFETLFPVAPRREGIAIDTSFTNPHVVEHADDYDPAHLDVPTLVVHAEDDPLADYEAAARFADRAPNAALRAYETGGHLVFGHGDDVRDAVTAFANAPADWLAATADARNPTL